VDSFAQRIEEFSGMFNRFSFSQKLIGLLGLVSVMIMVGVGVSSYLVLKKALINSINAELTQLTESTYHLVETSVNVSIKNYLRAVAEKGATMVKFYYRQVQQGVLTEEEAKKRVKALLLDPEYGQIGETGYLAGVNSAGVLVIHPKSEGVDASKNEFMQRAIKMKNGYLEYLWKNVGETVERPKAGYLSYFEPWDLMIWASSYKSEFHTLIDVNDFQDKILAIKIGATGYAYIMDSRGNVIIHPTMANQNIYDSQDAQGRYFIREICQRKNGSITYPWKNPGEQTSKEKLVYYTYLPEMDWIIACGVYVDELYAPVTKLIYTLLAISAGFLVLILVLAVFFGKSLTKPLRRLASYAEAIGNGDLTATMPVTSHDEIGYLSKTFNTMAANLNTFISQVQRSGIQVTSSSTELAATAKQQEVTMKVQVESSNKVLHSVEEIANVTEQLVQTMQGVASSSEDTTVTTEGQQTDLARMAGAMQHMEEASRMISGRLQAINEKADNITNIVTTITKVADQTNLLSLNAAIEAEKAGEYGRGFTVVAREIRRLADQTAVATLDIERMVREMQSTVASGVMEMDKFIAEVRNSAEDVKMVSAKLFQIIKQVQSLSPRFEEANHSMSDLSEGMRQTSESLSETFLAIGQLSEAAKGLQNEVTRFKVS
jgi:methyl-accepting chemotaxis protein